jgi:hypothetical protein
MGAFDIEGRVISKNDQGEIIIKHVISRENYVINWNEVPSSLKESIEFIYQGRIPLPSFRDNNIIEATAKLIDAARLHKDNFVFHFDLDLFNDNEIIVHIGEYSSKYYPKEYKKKTFCTKK